MVTDARAGLVAAKDKALMVQQAMDRAQFDDLAALPTDRLHKLAAARGVHVQAAASRGAVLVALDEWWMGAGAGAGASGAGVGPVFAYGYGGVVLDYSMLEVQLGQLLQAVGVGARDRGRDGGGGGGRGKKKIQATGKKGSKGKVNRKEEL
jgi:hypothetical protein